MELTELLENTACDGTIAYVKIGKMLSDPPKTPVKEGP
jgi:hypothetical protein